MKILKKGGGGVVEKRGEEETKSMPHAPVMGYTMLQFKRARENRYEIVKKLKENNVRDERKGLVFVFNAVSIGRSLVNNK